MAKRKRQRRGLGSSDAIHTKKATEASSEIGYSIAELTNRVRHGKCGAASRVYAEMMMHYGEYRAHRSAGGHTSAPSHEGLVQKATAEFNNTCLVNRQYRDAFGKRRRKARRR